LQETWQNPLRPYRLLALRWLATSHAAFAVLLLLMLRGRWWEGDLLVQCGLDGRAYVAGMCNCGGSLPTVCWISESINGTWGAEVGMSERIVLQSHVWLALSVLPAAAGLWLVVVRRRRLDVVVGLMSSAYLLIGLLPDTLPANLVGLHTAVAISTTCGGLLFQLCLPWRVMVLTISMYVILYLAISEFLIFEGASRHFTYDWTFTPGIISEPGSLVVVILEWVMVLGSIFVAVCYCVVEDLRCSKKQFKVVSSIAVSDAAAYFAEKAYGFIVRPIQN